MLIAGIIGAARFRTRRCVSIKVHVELPLRAAAYIAAAQDGPAWTPYGGLNSLRGRLGSLGRAGRARGKGLAPGATSPARVIISLASD